MANRKKVEEILMIARPDEFDIFLGLLDMDFMDIDDMSYESYAYLMVWDCFFFLPSGKVLPCDIGENKRYLQQDK